MNNVVDPHDDSTSDLDHDDDYFDTGNPVGKTLDGQR